MIYGQPTADDDETAGIVRTSSAEDVEPGEAELEAHDDAAGPPRSGTLKSRVAGSCRTSRCGQRCPAKLELFSRGTCSWRNFAIVCAALSLPALASLGLILGRPRHHLRKGAQPPPSVQGAAGPQALPSPAPPPGSAQRQRPGGQSANPAQPVAKEFSAPSGTESSETLDLGSGLRLRVLSPGDGETFPKEGDYIYVHYVGTLADGSLFDSSREREKPFGFPIGRGRVIQGWEVGLSKMSLGERAVLHIPSALAYGGRAHGQVPADSDLDFELELLVVGDRAHGLALTETTPGDRATFPKAMDQVVVNFKAYLPDGTKFDDTWARQQPFQFTVRLEQVMLGWDLGVLQMSLGERGMLRVPSALAFGSKGSGKIPPNSDLDFDIKLEQIIRRDKSCMIDNCPPPPPAGPAPSPAAAAGAAPAGAAKAEAAAAGATAAVVGARLELGRGLSLTEVHAGDGVHFPSAGDMLTMHYVGTLSKGGAKFDSSRDRGKPFKFKIGRGQVIEGWELGVMRMSLGERAILHVPSSLAYGRMARPGLPANSDLDFDVELLSIGDLAFHGAPAAPAPTPPTTMATRAPPTLAKPAASEPLDCRVVEC
mmetsp:Transcript_123861/g.395831  ORF Transcript_123861/g.395831 Transcript_123861/m.395831 type:complete len:596 (+) Transcript_123861:115-1902(+)